MSGGSWDYAYLKIESMAGELSLSKCSLRRAFGKHMELIAETMKSIEWVDSGDIAYGSDIDAIKLALGKDSKSQQLSILIEDAKSVVSELNKLLKEK